MSFSQFTSIPTPSMDKTKVLTFVSLFSSSGVGSYGFSQSGFDCVATVELKKKRMEVQRCNHICSSDSGYIVGDLTQEQTQEKLYNEVEQYLKQHQLSDLDALFAAIPSQELPSAEFKQLFSNKKQELKSPVLETLYIIRKLNPRFFVLECDQGFLTSTCQDSNGSLVYVSDMINRHLSEGYKLSSLSRDLDEYGCNSSRQCTLVFGVSKKLRMVTPNMLLPEKCTPKTLRELIGHLPALTKMGEFDPNDFYHHYRSFPEHMLPWIENLKEGESAFDNVDPKRRPHKVVLGGITFHKRGHKDKYQRQKWDQVACHVHTRNDTLSSQHTIHPRDNRVFSIRELMLMMSVPNEFKWTKESLEELNALPDTEKEERIKSIALPIRKCLGNSVPTAVVHGIAEKIKYAIDFEKAKKEQAQEIVKRFRLYNPTNFRIFKEAAESHVIPDDNGDLPREALIMATEINNDELNLILNTVEHMQISVFPFIIGGVLCACGGAGAGAAIGRLCACGGAGAGAAIGRLIANQDSVLKDQYNAANKSEPMLDDEFIKSQNKVEYLLKVEGEYPLQPKSKSTLFGSLKHGLGSFFGKIYRALFERQED